jgi:hypothetical protein
MEREKGFESPAAPVISRTYDTIEGDVRGSTEPQDASGRVATELHGPDDLGTRASLPAPTPELFLSAGTTIATLAAQAQQAASDVERFLRRAVDQAAAARAVERA